MKQALGLAAVATGIVLLWGAITGNSVEREFLAAIGIGTSATPSPSPAPATPPVAPIYVPPVDRIVPGEFPR